MADKNEEASQRFQDLLDNIQKKHEESVDAIFVSTITGVPLFQSGVEDEITSSSASGLFESVAIQIKKMNMGYLKSVTAFYENNVLIHVNMHPLVLTLIGNSGSNVGALQLIAPSLVEVLKPLQQATDSHVEA